MSEIDLGKLQGGVEEILKEQLGTLRDESENVAAWAKEIAGEMAAAIKAGDDSAADELVAQARLLAEIQRIKTERVAWDTLDKVMRFTLKAGVAVMKAVI